MKNKKIILGILLSLVLVYTGCRKFSEVENQNNPDKNTVLNSPEDIFGLTGGIINNWFQTTQEYEGMALALWVAADYGTCSWGNAAMKDISSEPRAAWNNDPAYAYAATSREFYLGLYNALSLSNDVLNQIVNEGIVIEGEGQTEMVEAVCRLGQGISLGYIGLVFDQGFIVDETVNLETDEITPSPYMDVVTQSMEYLDKCIEICNTSTFTLPETWIPGSVTYTNVELGQLANSFAASLLVYVSRNKAQNESKSTDWARVKAYAENGINFDFAPLADDVVWYSLYQTYSIYGGWGQVDMRVLHMLDPNMPDYFPASGLWDELPDEGVATSDDARLDTDFGYLSSCPFKPERGYYHFSSYRYSRLDLYLETYTEPNPVMYQAENDLLLAEAELRLGNLEAAVDIINAGTRVTRGELAPLDAGASFEEIEDAIFYERTIELFISGCGTPFFDMRRKDMLQTGTPLHFPIPGQQLDVMLMPQYSFGGVDNADGENTSDGGWNKAKGYNYGNSGSKGIFSSYGADLPRIK